MASDKKQVLPFVFILALNFVVIGSNYEMVFAGACQDSDSDGYYHISSPSYCGDGVPKDCDDNDPNVYPGHGCNIVEDIEDLIEDVEDIIHGGDADITDGQINAILGKLDKAIDKVESNNHNAAIGSLNAFINQINAFINSGSISQEDGQLLINAAMSIIDTLD